MRSIYLCERYRSVTRKQKNELEKIVGEPLPNGLERGLLCVPAGTYAWQLDDEFKVVLRYSKTMRPEDRKSCDELAERNQHLSYLLRKF